MSRQQAQTSHTGRQQARTTQSARQKSYIEGNTVRKLESGAERQRREQPARKQKKLDHAARANRERAMQLNPGYVLFLTAALAITVAICVTYIQMQSDINSRMKNIASLEGQVLDLKTDNDTTEKRVDTSLDLDAIKNTAVNELGMVYPTKDQIVYFEVNTNDYMNQYQDIPEK